MVQIARPHRILNLLAVVCFIIAIFIGADWVTESGKVADVLVFNSMGLALFAAAHLP